MTTHRPPLAIGNRYTSPRRVEAAGAWIAFISCRRCGCALVLDPGDTDLVMDIHDRVCPGEDR